MDVGAVFAIQMLPFSTTAAIVVPSEDMVTPYQVCSEPTDVSGFQVAP